MSVAELLTLVLAAVERSERSFICCAIDQYSNGDAKLAEAALKAVSKYKPSNANKDFIGWWSLYDRKSRIVALKKAIKDYEK